MSKVSLVPPLQPTVRVELTQDEALALRDLLAAGVGGSTVSLLGLDDLMLNLENVVPGGSDNSETRGRQFKSSAILDD